MPGLESKDLTKARILDEETGKSVGDLLRLVFIQLTMFRKMEDECEREYEQWIYNLKNMGQRQAVAFQGRNVIFRRLADISNVASLSPEERRSYEADVKNARDYHNQMEFARSEGWAEGRAEGEHMALEKIARKMRSQGYTDEQIRDVTGVNVVILDKGQ